MSILNLQKIENIFIFDTYIYTRRKPSKLFCGR